MFEVREHREARKERQDLPTPVREAAELVMSVLGADPYARGLTRERLKGWGKRVVLVYGTMHRGVTYRMAWEVQQPKFIALIWAYGPHEGFYQKLNRRARRR
jgi:mRNA-degrading endonuclease RelE of RelBE toxin-antitoxin system